MSASVPSRLVAIVGGSGAGKTWLADRLHQLLGEKAGRLSQDDFYRDQSALPPSRRNQLNFDHPDAIEWPLLERVLQSFAAGRPARVPRYDFRTHCRLNGTEQVQPRPVTLVEGLWLLQSPAMRRTFHLKIFLECPEKVRLRRRLARDVAERGRSPASVRRQFRLTVAPMHRRHVAPQARWADLVLRHPHSEAGIRQLHEAAWNLLKSDALMPAWMRETFRAELSALLKNHDKKP